MRALWQHLRDQPFIVATGLAALVHSTWSLGTLFSGTEPQFSLNWLFWLIPALLLAGSLDVGQIVTSDQIRSGHRTRAKYATFLVFAVGTYYLQWLFIASHMPDVPLSSGVRADWVPLASIIRDCGLWLLPGLLPLSTVLYTFSYEQPANPVTHEAISPQPTAHSGDVRHPTALPDPVAPMLAAGESFVFHCQACGYDKSYSTADGAKKASYGHKPHCPAVKKAPAKKKAKQNAV